MPSLNPSPVFEAIAAHAAAYAAFHAVCHLTDGRKATAAEQAEYDLKGHAEDAARLALCAAPFRNTAELRAKAAYIRSIRVSQIDLQTEDYDALLASLTQGRVDSIDA